jgi:hypothetical protein
MTKFGALILASAIIGLPIASAWAGEEPPPGKEPGKEPEKAPEKEIPKDPEVVKICLMDGSIFSGKLSVKELTVETKFGLLKVPVTDIRSFTPGLESHPELDAQISGMVEKLGSEVFATREQAQKALVKMGRSIEGELKRSLKDPEPERRTRIQAILDEFEKGAAAEGGGAAPSEEEVSSETWIREDRIESTAFTMIGKASPRTFDVISPYGKLSLKLADVKWVRRDSSDIGEIRRTVNVEGACLITKSPKDTGITLKKGDKVVISAEGAITMTPWGNQTSGPDGDGNNYGWYQDNQIPNGALVARIGEDSKVMLIGSTQNFTAEHTGRLKLAVAISQNMSRYTYPGTYTVKIKIIRKE